MRKEFAKIILCLGLGFVLAPAAFAEDAPARSIQDQLNQIITSQTIINQRLSAIENNLRAMQRPQPAPNMPPPEDMDKEYTIDVGHASVYGDKNGKVTIVEFSDYQCPFSQRFHPIFMEAVKAYPKGVKYILKDFPLQFHPNARPAAKAALAAKEQGKYWEMSEALFANGNSLSEDKYKELAGNLGLNVDKFMKDLKERDTEWDKLIDADIKQAGEIDVRGTPTFYINGKKTRVRDVNALKAEIDKILNSK